MRLSATHLGTTGSGSSAVRFIRSAAFIGSSSVEQNYSAFSGPTFSNQGFAVWCCAYLRQRLMMAYNAVKGTYEFAASGANTATMRTDPNLGPAAISAQPDVAFIYAGMTECASNTIATTAVALERIQGLYADLIAGGIKKVVIMATGPRNAGAPNASGYLARQQALVAALASWTSSAGIPYFDGNSVIQNPSTGDWVTGYTYDGIHPNAFGAAYLGKALAQWCLANLNLGPEPFAYAPRLANLKGVNPFNLGGSATLAANTSFFPGSRAAMSLETATDGGARWQRQNIFSAPNATVESNTVEISLAAVSLATAGLATGQRIRHWIELDTGNAGGIRWQLHHQLNGTGSLIAGSLGVGANLGTLTNLMPTWPTPLVFCSPTIVIPGDATTISGRCHTIAVATGTNTTIRYRYAGVEIVSSAAPPAIGS